MRVALCFSGLTRFWNVGYKFHYENLIKEYEPDIFIHTWYDNDINENDEVIKTYKPKKYAVDKNNQIVLKQTYPRGTSERYKAYNIFSLYRSIEACNNLKRLYEIENQFRYDWVFRLRMDYAVNRKFDLSSLDSDKIHFPSDLQERNMVTDQFAFSSSQNMDTYSSVYNFLDDYYNDGEDMIGEHMLIRHLTQRKIYDKRVYHDMKHPFYPGTAGSMNNSLIRSDISIRDNDSINIMKGEK
jgi:hypothetical protein